MTRPACASASPTTSKPKRGRAPKPDLISGRAAKGEDAGPCGDRFPFPARGSAAVPPFPVSLRSLSLETMAWFRKTKKPKPVRQDRPRSTVPEGLWVKCEGCKEIVYSRDLDRNLKVCPKCGYHFRIDARARVSLLLDDPQPRELFTNVSPVDPLSSRA